MIKGLKDVKRLLIQNSRKLFDFMQSSPSLFFINLIKLHAYRSEKGKKEDQETSGLTSQRGLAANSRSRRRSKAGSGAGSAGAPRDAYALPDSAHAAAALPLLARPLPLSTASAAPLPRAPAADRIGETYLLTLQSINLHSAFTVHTVCNPKYMRHYFSSRHKKCFYKYM